MDRKAQFIEVFRDTQLFYTENAALADAVASSRKATKLYEANEYPDMPADNRNHLGEVRVSKSKTFDAAIETRLLIGITRKPALLSESNRSSLLMYI